MVIKSISDELVVKKYVKAVKKKSDLAAIFMLEKELKRRNLKVVHIKINPV